jgi:hypothetical protein
MAVKRSASEKGGVYGWGAVVKKITGALQVTQCAFITGNGCKLKQFHSVIQEMAVKRSASESNNNKSHITALCIDARRLQFTTTSPYTSQIFPRCKAQCVSQVMEAA